jgi:hypothetical protein
VSPDVSTAVGVQFRIRVPRPWRTCNCLGARSSRRRVRPTSLLYEVLTQCKGGPTAITPIAYAKTLTNKFGSEDLIDSAELAQRGPRMFRDWNDVDKLYDKRQLTALSKMITGAALNEVNGALALLVRCSELVYSYERNWLEFYQVRISARSAPDGG